MDSADPPEGLHLSRSERAVKIDPSLSGTQLPGECVPGDPEMPAEQPACTARVRQLVWRNSDVIELLTDSQGDPVTIVESATTRREHGALSPLLPGLLGPALTLKELQLSRPREYGDNDKHKAELDSSDAGPGLGHQRPTGLAGDGTAKRTNSESAGS
jgi:hypothetical protein